jgi:hypothetical protein
VPGKDKDDIKKSRQIKETEQWVTAKKGQRFAPNTYVDSHGVLRSSGDGSCVVWHHNERQRREHGLSGPCTRRGIQPAQIVYDPVTGAPWCDICWPYEVIRQDAERKKNLEQTVEKLFGSN